MNLRLLPPATLLAAALLLSACESSYRARVHRLPELPQAINTGGQAQGGLRTQHLRPQTHSGFTYLPEYPKTLSTWHHEALLRTKGHQRLIIDLTTQRGLYLVNGLVALDFPVCTGKADKPTPKGEFRITQKSKQHFSNLYHVPMPYFMRLTNDGIGLHVGKVRRKPSSHGCIRLQQEECKLLFHKLAPGTPVTIR